MKLEQAIARALRGEDHDDADLKLAALVLAIENKRLQKREAELETEITRLRAAIIEFVEADSEISPSKSVSEAEHRQVVARWDAAIKALHEQAAEKARRSDEAHVEEDGSESVGVPGVSAGAGCGGRPV